MNRKKVIYYFTITLIHIYELYDNLEKPLHFISLEHCENQCFKITSYWRKVIIMASVLVKEWYLLSNSKDVIVTKNYIISFSSHVKKECQSKRCFHLSFLHFQFVALLWNPLCTTLSICLIIIALQTWVLYQK